MPFYTWLGPLEIGKVNIINSSYQGLWAKVLTQRVAESKDRPPVTTPEDPAVPAFDVRESHPSSPRPGPVLLAERCGPRVLEYGEWSLRVPANGDVCNKILPYGGRAVSDSATKLQFGFGCIGVALLFAILATPLITVGAIRPQRAVIGCEHHHLTRPFSQCEPLQGISVQVKSE